jgi:hypothetical protein
VDANVATVVASIVISTLGVGTAWVTNRAKAPMAQFRQLQDRVEFLESENKLCRESEKQLREEIKAVRNERNELIFDNDSLSRKLRRAELRSASGDCEIGQPDHE